ncbi:predicted protein [Thalassiosira pseudonana CCMP1335]|jgi:hypothetical protein|uniref:PS II complex 12 kDa extrinsic protein n=1 Tax=Thalassiosira pseudonana TaxID=35128 RepID=B8CEN2_THAPS|nr:predicted protein [Thalassiosira pseudonana CCMP1335]EED88065.1 predicted protein [Thalassiosira pseudonana CCMP1335]|mmetsp:Transcript_463/g.1107  ORF Transcript_463/g.1107 Transcript_463/m.1107 type:complete len:198 (+) Transcript_463:186-779(+)|eukprot:scaffold3420_cov239-Alexandrium_tamarense.AAC.5
MFKLLSVLFVVSSAYALQPSMKTPWRAHPHLLSRAQSLFLESTSYSDEHTDHAFNRRNALKRTANIFLSISTASIAVTPANADVIRSPGRCANGEGDGCDSLAEGNAFIESLQKKSLENKEENQKEALYAYYMKNYPDVFAVSDKRMVKRQDGSFVLYSLEEVKEMTNQGKIAIEYPKTKGGRVADLTQKPVLVLKE